MAVQRKSDPASRPYRMRARLEGIEETRQRIAAATFELHATIGPAKTTISAIADRAGVQRHTVYHHFPDLISLFQACTAHGIRVTKPPTAEGWRAIADPSARARHALGEVYPYYRQHARLIGNVVRDMPRIPGGIEGSREFLDIGESWFAALSEGWPASIAGTTAVEAALRHALDYGTWLSLTSQGLSDDQASDAMGSFISLMGARPPKDV
jgi:AcrR family transcriptional regulator